MKMYGEVILFAGLLIGAGGTGDAVKQERQQLEGTWLVVSAGSGTKALKELKGATLTFSGGKVSLSVGGKRKEGTFTIDPAKDPKHIDLALEDREGKAGKPEVIRGIYQQEGDEMTVCLGGAMQKKDPQGKVLSERPSFRPLALDSRAREDIRMTLRRAER